MYVISGSEITKEMDPMYGGCGMGAETEGDMGGH